MDYVSCLLACPLVFAVTHYHFLPWWFLHCGIYKIILSFVLWCDLFSWGHFNPFRYCFYDLLSDSKVVLSPVFSTTEERCLCVLYSMSHELWVFPSLDGWDRYCFQDIWAVFQMTLSYPWTLSVLVYNEDSTKYKRPSVDLPSSFFVHF